MDPVVYGLDIETDTAAGGLDPAVAGILAVAVAGDGEPVVFTGPEPSILLGVDSLLAHLAPGVLVTWNGASFDLPFLAARAAHHGIALGLRLVTDPSPDGHGHAADTRPVHRASWYAHDHLDAYRLYRSDVGRVLPVSCSLKSIARLVGIDAVEVDASAVHELTPAQLARYVASDAVTARALALRRWATAARFTDRLLDGRPGDGVVGDRRAVPVRR